MGVVAAMDGFKPLLYKKVTKEQLDSVFKMCDHLVNQ